MPTKLRGKVKDDYLELILQCPLVSLQSEADFDFACEFIQKLLRQGKLSKGKLLYLYALTELVENYDDEHYPIPQSTDAEILEHLMEAQGVSQAEFSRETGIPKSTVSLILSGKRPFAKSLIGKLSDYFHVPKSVFTRNL